MVKALSGKKGKVALLGLIEQTIDQQAFKGFRSIAEKAGLTSMDPQEDKGNQAEAARVAAAVIQANPDLVGMADIDNFTEVITAPFKSFDAANLNKVAFKG